MAKDNNITGSNSSSNMSTKRENIGVGNYPRTLSIDLCSLDHLRPQQGDLRLRALHQARAPMAGLEPATERSLHISGGLATHSATDAPGDVYQGNV
ncbi:hypothetical protein PoB_006349600 [Plakobranchus ocellatus]|uniref:Uncharacterized protein n=1 Tax=Plakobranchus ocellatus TaxID=259542 RepID=A0AAV4CZ33_9GAST|nr:hypothetical protein PoB_006349600 [Plakobranchus ocellatus]